MDLAPVAVTQVNWPSFDDACRRSLGYTPIKAIDESQFKLSDPAAFLSTLNFDDPLRTLREGDLPSFAHYHVTFAGVLSDYDLVKLINESRFTVTTRELKRNELFVMITGNILQWREFTIRNCSKNSELRVIANLIYVRFKQAGFREMFDGLGTHKLADGTFILK